MAKRDQIQVAVHPLPTNKITILYIAALPLNGIAVFLLLLHKIFINKVSPGNLRFNDIV